MQQVTLQQMVDLSEAMPITQSIDSGFIVTYHGHVEGVPTVAISTCPGMGDCYIIQ